MLHFQKVYFMLKKGLVIIGVFLLTLSSLESSAQDPEFSQFYANPLYLNPALAGANICPRVILNYRNQWPSLKKGYVTYNASYDQYIDKIHGGVGVIVNADVAGDGLLTTTSASLMYAFNLRAGKNLYFQMAVQASFYQKSLGWEKLIFADQYDPSGFIKPTNEQQPDNLNVIFPDFAAGITFGYKSRLYGGVAVHHLTEPNMAFYNSETNKLPMKITADLGYSLPLDGGGGEYGDASKFSLSFNGLYQQQGKWHQINAGVYLLKYPFVIGGWFRHNFENADAFVALIGLTYESLKVGYSYDVSLSNLSGNSGGAHEVSLAWQFGCSEKRRKIKAIKCPEF